MAATKKPTKAKENGRTVYRDGNGNKITYSQYSKQLKAYNESQAVYSTKTENGKTTYYKNGKKISKSSYQKATTNKTTYEQRTQNGKTTYYKNGKQISQKAYNNAMSSNPQPYSENGKYYDKNGNEISKSTYDSQMKSIQNQKAVEKSKVTWSKKSDYTDEYKGTLEDLAKKIKDNPKLTLQDAKAITDNQEYINTRDALAKSLLDGSYYNQETDPYAQQYREDYIRQGQRAMDDTMANLSKRTGGLASSYAGAVAQSKYNDYMDALAGKLLDLRSLAEASARNNMSMYDTMNNEYRTGQIQNNDVINQNNAARTQEWNAYMGQLTNALGAYNDLSNNAYSRWLQGQQMYQNQKQFDDDLAYKYAALAASETPAASYSYSGGGGSGSGSGSYSSGGIDSSNVNQTAVAAKKVSDGYVVDRINGSKAGNEYGYDYINQNTLKDYPWK